MCVAANGSELLCVAHFHFHLQTFKKNKNAFYTILTFHFKYQVLYTCKLASLCWRKSTQRREVVFSLRNEWNLLKMCNFQSLRVNTFLNEYIWKKILNIFVIVYLLVDNILSWTLVLCIDGYTYIYMCVRTLLK